LVETYYCKLLEKILIDKSHFLTKNK
jgi:hypothetical protein